MTDDVLRLKPGDDLRMMKTPDLWRLGPVLCLKNGERSRDDGDRGVLVLHSDIGRTDVYLLNILDPRLRQLLDGDNTGLSYVHYEDFEGIVDDGWVVD